LDTLECHFCRNDDKDDSANGNEEDANQFDKCHLLDRIGIIAISTWVAELIVDSEKEDAWNVDRSFNRHSIDGRRNDDILSCLDGRKTAPPTFGAGSRDDDVCPSHMKTAHGDSSNDCYARANYRILGARGKEEDDQAVNDVVDDHDVKATEGGQATTLCFEMFDSGEHLRGDRLLLDEEEVGFDKLHLL